MRRFDVRRIRLLRRVPRVRVRVHPRVTEIGRAIKGQMPRFRGVIGPADLLTLTNALAGFLAVAVVTGVANLYEPPFFPGLDRIFPGLGPDDTFLLASVLITVGLVADALDGIVARKFGGSRLGADLDTLADTVTFVVAPAFMVYAYYGGVHGRVYPALLSAGLVLVMGMLRLARFNANPIEGTTTTFQGLPTPWGAITIALIVLARIPPTFALPLVVVIAFLMMSNVAYPKSRGRTTVLAILMAAAALVMVGVILFFPDNQPRVLRGTFTFVALAIALLPFLLARRVRTRGA